MRSGQPTHLLTRVRALSWLLAGVWTGCVACSLLWNLHQLAGQAVRLARRTAQVTFENDVLYRRWAAQQGGVYVPVSPHTPPNPYLQKTNRDVVTTSGLALTLVNPAYMARQVQALAAGGEGSRGRLTSLNPLRPQNAPDPWEAEALRSLEQGVTEVSSIESMPDGEHLRLMRPFVTEPSCLECHGAQGYRVGDIRGGISVSVPLASLRAIEEPTAYRFTGAHAGLWLIGLAGIALFRRSLGKEILARDQASADLQHEVAERRSVETRLRETNERYELVLAGAEAAIWDWDLLRQTVTFSPRWRTMRGLAIEEVTDSVEEWSKGIHPDDAPRVLAAVHAHLDGQTPFFAEEYRVRHKDGSWLWIADRGVARRDASGRAVRMAGSETDISGRKRAEQTLEAERELLATVVTHLPAATCLIRGSDLRLELVNPAYQAIAPGKTMAGKTLDELWPETGQNFAAICGQVIETGEPHLAVDELNLIRRQPDGPLEQAYFTWSLHRVRLPGQDGWGLLNVAWETTARKTTEEALRESEARLRLAQDSAGAGIWGWEVASGKLSWSEELFRLFGLDPKTDKADFEVWNRVLHPDDRLAAQQRIDTAIATHTPLANEYRIVLPSGEVRWISALGNTSYDPSGKPQRMSGICIDITQRRCAEDQLRQTAIELQAANAFLRESRRAAIKLMDDAVTARQRAEEVSAALRQEVAERQRAEAELRRRNRRLRVLRSSEHARLHAWEEEQFLQDACQIIVRESGHAKAWVGLPQSDPIKTVRAVASAGFDPGSVESWQLTWADAASGENPTGAVLRTGTVAVCQNLLDQPTAPPWHDEASRCGAASAAVLPLLSEGQAIGALHVYAIQPDQFPTDEIDLLREIADDVAHGLTTIRLRRAHLETEARLAYLASFPEQDPNPVIEVELLGGTPVYRNPAAERLLPDLATQASEHPFLNGLLDVIAALRREPSSPVRRELMAGDTCYAQTFTLVRGGQRVRVYAIDITERVQAEEGLRRSHTRIDLLAETASELLKSESPQSVVETLCSKVLPVLDCQVFFNFVVDEARRQLHLNACAGISQDEAARLEWLDDGVAVCGSAARDGCPIVAQDILNTPDPRMELLRSLGVQAYACHPLLAQGRVLGTLSFGTRNRTRFTEDEISLMEVVADQVAIAMQRKRAEAELRHINADLEQRVAERTTQLAVAAAYARRLIEVSLDPVVTISPTGEITDVNKATETVTGVPRERLIGSRFSDYFTEPSQAEAVYHQVLTQGVVRDLPLTIRHVSGRMTDVLYNATVYRNDANEVQGVFAAARDITDRKAAELERQKLRDELARVSRITTAGQLAASLAHELNQPLGAIACNVQAIENLLAQRTYDDAEVREALKDIDASSQRAGSIIHQLRGLYQKTGRERTSLQLNELIHATADLLRGELVLRQVTLQLDLHPHLPPVCGNAVELQQVLLNLVTNAIEAMSGCDSNQCLLLLRTSPDGPQAIRLSVRDSGPGLADDQLRRVFEPFFSTKPNGMGMGLAICRSILEAHEGRLWAENNPDRGATFHLTLPTFPLPSP